jgi:protein-S-isoprenylcysteine O-methyltransferase Ste14
MLFLRAIAFSVLLPGFIAIGMPLLLTAHREIQNPAAFSLIAVGAVFYLATLMRFLAAGGTPAIFFTRPMRWLVGSEPDKIVQGGLYRYSRNPMYIGVSLTAAGLAWLLASRSAAIYAALLWPIFHFVVVVLEEPHLRKKLGARYEEYLRTTPRWIGFPKR